MVQARISRGRRLANNIKRSIKMDIILWIAQVLVAAAFVVAGTMKLFQYERARASLSWVNDVPRGLVAFIGAAEILGGLGLVLPAVTGILPWLTPLAGLGLVLVMLLASAFHATRREYSGIATNVVLLLLAAFVAYGRWFIQPL
jgi:uncharacterized membrane protein YphA (DoxX/SURF4 family)